MPRFVSRASRNGSNGNGSGRLSGLAAEIKKRSVTASEQIDINTTGAGGIYYFQFPMTGALGMLASTHGLPPYWSHARDQVLRSSVLIEGQWANAVGMFLSKLATLSWELRPGVERLQEMLLEKWTTWIYKCGRDFVTTDNGMFFEIVHASSAAGSRILGINHLDSCRCTLTGDPDWPVIYRDLFGALHKLAPEQVVHLSDMTSPGEEYWGVGLCPASRAWDGIVTMASIEQLIQEKTTGSEPTGISFVNSSMDEHQLKLAVDSAKEGRSEQGYVRYMGMIVIPLVNLDADPKVATIPLKGLPDGFVATDERENCQLKYANALGLSPQALNPRLIGTGSRGTSAQSRIIEEQEQGKLPAMFRKEIAHLLNWWVLPSKTTFYFTEKDYTDMKKVAEIGYDRARTRYQQVQTGEITNQEARELAIRADDLPKDFGQGEIIRPLSDDDKQQAMDAEGHFETTTSLPLPDVEASEKEIEDLVPRPSLPRVELNAEQFGLLLQALSLKESRPSDEVHVHIPEIKPPDMSKVQLSVEAPIHLSAPIKVEAPITIETPEQKEVVVPPPQVVVQVEPTPVNIQVPESSVTVEAPQVTVNIPPPVAPIVTVESPQVTVQNQVPVPEVKVNVEVPVETEATTQVVRDSTGFITGQVTRTKKVE